jgi:hypothetical protein
LRDDWRELRAEFALAGIDWRSWSAADHAAVGFLLLKRHFAGDSVALRALFELVEDTAAVAAIDRVSMGQPDRVEVRDRP